MTGYVSSMLASLCNELIIIENEANLITKIKENIKKLLRRAISLVSKM